MATYEIRYADLYNPVVNQHTRFDSIHAMFDSWGFNFSSVEEFKFTRREEFDALARAETPFDSWDEFTTAATQRWLCQELRISRCGCCHECIKLAWTKV